MSGRYMRVIVFFDLPVTTPAGRRAYTQFRKFLVKNGFIMMQESVYSKIAVNQLAANAIITRVRANCPGAGLVQVLTITEKQYASIEMIVGDSKSDVLDSSERMVVL